MFLVLPDANPIVLEDDTDAGLESLVRLSSSLLAALIALLWIALQDPLPPLRDQDWTHW